MGNGSGPQQASSALGPGDQDGLAGRPITGLLSAGPDAGGGKGKQDTGEERGGEGRGEGRGGDGRRLEKQKGWAAGRPQPLAPLAKGRLYP